MKVRERATEKQIQDNPEDRGEPLEETNHAL